MSSSSEGWQPVPSRRSTPLRVAQGPPAMNTRSSSNFAARQSQANRFIPSPPADSNPDHSFATQSSDAISSSPARTSSPSTQQPNHSTQAPSPMRPDSSSVFENLQESTQSLPSVIPSAPSTTDPSSSTATDHHHHFGESNVNVSDASASQYSTRAHEHVVPAQAIESVSQTTSRDRNQTVPAPVPELSPGTIPSYSTSTTDETATDTIDYGSILDPPQVDYIERIFNAIDMLQDKVAKSNEQTSESIYNLQGDMRQLRQAALLIDPTVFGYEPSVPPSLTNVRNSSPQSEETGVSYSPVEPKVESSVQTGAHSSSCNQNHQVSSSPGQVFVKNLSTNVCERTPVQNANFSLAHKNLSNDQVRNVVPSQE